MGQWTETLEPYIKVQERVKTATLNPVAGEDLIIGATIISDAGPSEPTLITNQSEFIKTYASQNISEDYIKSLNNLYSGADNTLAATMWANAYRLCGSNSLLITRAASAKGINFVKPIISSDALSTYILRDGELLKKVNPFKIVVDAQADGINYSQDGWAIYVNEVGRIGNLNNDEGPMYDYYVKNIPELVQQLNETSKFFSPKYKFYTDASLEEEVIVDYNDEASKDSALVVVFEEVYLAAHFLDVNSDPINFANGLAYMLVCQPSWTITNQAEYDLTVTTDFEVEPYYAVNVYNSASNLKVRIRRFNHDAVVAKTLAASETTSLTKNGKSPYVVLDRVLDTFTKNGEKEPSASILARDFFEVAVMDPSKSDSVSFFNVGNIAGRGDIEMSELNDLLGMIQLNLPDDLHDLGLNYYGYDSDDIHWEEIEETEELAEALAEIEDETLPPVPTELVNGQNVKVKGQYTRTKTILGVKTVKVTSEDENGEPIEIEKEEPVVEYKYYVSSDNGTAQAFVDLTIDPTKYYILTVNDSNLKAAMDEIENNEVFTVEGLTDLGNTEPSFQDYLANMAINSNYFYPISTVLHTNYMTIGNFASKMSKDSFKLYMSAPWDIDTNTLGWKFYASPSVIYWEAVARNRRNNEEFRGILGQVGGIVQYQKPLTEFNKKIRQLLLSKKVNTVTWNVQTQAWNMNDNYTKQSTDTIMSDEGNSRFGIRISKSMPTLLRQFIGRKITERLCSDVKDTIEYFFKTKILTLGYTVNGYQVFCNYDEDLARQNRIKVVVNVRFDRSLKYVNVYDNFFDVGMDISSSEE